MRAHGTANAAAAPPPRHNGYVRQRRARRARVARRTLIFVPVSAPRSTSSCTTPKWPLPAATDSGVAPYCAWRDAHKHAQGGAVCAAHRPQRSCSQCHRVRMRQQACSWRRRWLRRATDWQQTEINRSAAIAPFARAFAPFLQSAAQRSADAPVPMQHAAVRRKRAQRSAPCPLPPCRRRTPPAAQRTRRGHCPRRCAAASCHPARMQNGAAQRR
jgi:hypothetical protein